MCSTCGCSNDAGVRVTDPAARPHQHAHDHAHPHAYEHEPEARTVVLEEEILAKNDRLAADNRGWLEGRGVLAVNLMSSPGAGKTALLERAVRDLAGGDGPYQEVAVIEGDQETLLDSERIQASGCRVIQINTGAGCHLDATMLRDGLAALDPVPRSLVFVENVGNLVCPALFDLGEGARAVIMAVTEGEDKPLKYPHMFRAADVMLLNKVDLLPYLDFDVDRLVAHAREVSPGLEILRVSATRGDGLDAWYAWLRQGCQRFTRS